MAQIILVEPQKELRELLALNIKNFLARDVIERKNASEVLALLDILPTISLIITSELVGEEKTGNIISSSLVKSSYSGGLIIMGDLPNIPGIEKIASSVPKEEHWEQVILLSARLLNLNPYHLGEKFRPDYIPIPINYFDSLSSSCCDIFIRIKKSSEVFQYVKRIHQFDTFDAIEIERYHSQGLEFFYIQKKDEQNFTNYLSNILVSKLENKTLDINEKVGLISASHNIAINEILKVGFNSATIQLTESIIESMMETLDAFKDISPLLRKIINSKGTFNYIHAHMTCAVAVECLKKLENLNPKAYKKMAYAAFFKDAYLFHHDNSLQMINSRDLLNNKSKLSQKDYELVIGHALDASELVKKYTDIALGVDELILHHHASKTGIGFHPNHIEELDQESQVFIFSSEFVDKLLYYKEHGGQATPIILEMKKNYSGPKMSLIVNALEVILAQKED